MASTRPRAPLRGPVDDAPDAQKRWWNAPQAPPGAISEMGTLLFSELSAIERSQMRQRYMYYVSALLMHGRAPATFGYSMTSYSGREAQAMTTALFRPPSLNCIASVGDTLKERIWSRVSWLDWLPLAKSDYESRERCKQTTDWMQAKFEADDFDDLVESTGEDSATYGTGIAKTMPTRDGKDVVNTRVLIDEMRVSSDANFGEPRQMGQVTFEAREDLINIYAVGPDKATIREAILKAPAAHRGFQSLDVNYADIIALSEGFKFNLPDGTPGRHALVLANGFTLVDEEWTLGNPYTVRRYNKLARSYTGKGVPENCLGLQLELDRAVACRAEAQRVASYPRVQVSKESHVNDNEIEDMGIIHYTGQPVIFELPKGTAQDIDATIKSLKEEIFAREGISQQTAGGDIPAGLDAAVAIEAFQKISDGRLYSHAKVQERFIEEIGTRMVKTAAVVNPKVRVGTKEMHWSAVKADLKTTRMRAFPLSKLPSSLPAQVNVIERWAKAGSITPVQKARLQGLPDPQGQLPMIAASENCILKQLGRIVLTGECEPPDPDTDPQGAYDTAKAFKLVAVCDELPRDRIVELTKFVRLCKDRLAAAAPPPPAAPMPAGMPAQQPPTA